MGIGFYGEDQNNNLAYQLIFQFNSNEIESFGLKFINMKGSKEPIKEGDIISLHFDRGEGKAWFEINGSLIGKVVQNEMFHSGFAYPYLAMSQIGQCVQELQPDEPEEIEIENSEPGTPKEGKKKVSTGDKTPDRPKMAELKINNI